jgi:hypothetical protein
MTDDTPLLSEAPAVNGWYVPAHGKGRLRPFRRGQSGNPSGKGGHYHEIVRIAREASPRAMAVLVQVMDDETEDTRCRLVAIQEILGRGFGKIPAEVKDVAAPALEIESVSEEKLSLVIRALEAARDAKRAGAQGGEGEGDGGET